jgi:hypothetical protein
MSAHECHCYHEIRPPTAKQVLDVVEFLILNHAIVLTELGNATI